MENLLKAKASRRTPKRNPTMKIRLSMLITLTTALAPLPLCAQSSVGPPKVVKVTLHPMPEPRPALKHRLLPSLLDCRPGNAAVLWNRIPAERQGYFNELYKQGGVWERVEKWMEIPVSDPREKQFRDEDKRKYAGNWPMVDFIRDVPYADMARAARFESCDWQLPIHEGNVYSIMLPEVNQLRQYGRLLAAKARLEIAEGNYDQAVETLQTGLALARDTAKGPTLIHALVGSAIASIVMNQTEQLVQRPDAPNLYWALTALPQPLIDYRLGFEVESNGLFLQFPELRDLDKKELAPDQWTKLLEKTTGKGFFSRGAANDRGESLIELSTVALALQGYPVAKQYLIEHGRAASEVEAMPVAKAILVYSVQRYRELCDESHKAIFLPYADGKKWLQQAEEAVKMAASRREEIIPFATTLLPALNNAKISEPRLEWSLARLRILEALRIYAAAHDGKLPERLEDIAEVPIPRNPFDDKPFHYHRDANRAVLDSEQGPPGLPWRYEITMLSKGE